MYRLCASMNARMYEGAIATVRTLKFISDICTELNSIWGDLLGISLKPIKWETDMYPGVSKYSQDVINKEIDEDFDIFIAMLLRFRKYNFL